MLAQPVMIDSKPGVPETVKSATRRMAAADALIVGSHEGDLASSTIVLYMGCTDSRHACTSRRFFAQSTPKQYASMSGKMSNEWSLKLLSRSGREATTDSLISARRPPHSHTARVEAFVTSSRCGMIVTGSHAFCSALLMMSPGLEPTVADPSCRKGTARIARRPMMIILLSSECRLSWRYRL